MPFQVNNAGEGCAANGSIVESEDLDFYYETLLKSVFMMTKLCFPYLEKAKGDLSSVSPSGHVKPALKAVWLVVTLWYQLIRQICALPLWWSVKQFVESASFLLLNHLF